jgi:uncharacterized circularly permuted ATP-grasp superfamily protein
VDFVQQVESSQRLLMGNISLLDISRQVSNLYRVLPNRLRAPSGTVYNIAYVPSILLSILHHRQDVHQGLH